MEKLGNNDIGPPFRRLTGVSTVIGRASLLDEKRRPCPNNLFFMISQFSKKHAKLIWIDEVPYVVDTSSSLGTTVNNNLLREDIPYPIKEGDVIGCVVYLSSDMVKELRKEAAVKQFDCLPLNSTRTLVQITIHQIVKNSFSVDVSVRHRGMPLSNESITKWLDNVLESEPGIGECLSEYLVEFLDECPKEFLDECEDKCVFESLSECLASDLSENSSDIYSNNSNEMITEENEDDVCDEIHVDIVQEVCIDSKALADTFSDQESNHNSFETFRDEELNKELGEFDLSEEFEMNEESGELDELEVHDKLDDSGSSDDSENQENTWGEDRSIVIIKTLNHKVSSDSESSYLSSGSDDDVIRIEIENEASLDSEGPEEFHYGSVKEFPSLLEIEKKPDPIQVSKVILEKVQKNDKGSNNSATLSRKRKAEEATESDQPLRKTMKLRTNSFVKPILGISGLVVAGYAFLAICGLYLEHAAIAADLV